VYWQVLGMIDTQAVGAAAAQPCWWHCRTCFIRQKTCKSCKYYQSAIRPCTHCTLVSSQNDHVAQPESPDICSSVALVIQATDEVPSRRLVLTRSPILYVSNILRTSAVLCWAYMAQKGSIAPPAASMIRAPPPGC